MSNQTKTYFNPELIQELTTTMSDEKSATAFSSVDPQLLACLMADTQPKKDRKKKKLKKKLKKLYKLQKKSQRQIDELQEVNTILISALQTQKQSSGALPFLQDLIKVGVPKTIDLVSTLYKYRDRKNYPNHNNVIDVAYTPVQKSQYLIEDKNPKK